MIKLYYDMIINNNLMLSGAIAVISVLIFYLENRRTKQPHNYSSYAKLLIIIFGAINLVLHVKNKNITIKETNVKIGEPDF